MFRGRQGCGVTMVIYMRVLAVKGRRGCRGRLGWGFRGGRGFRGQIGVGWRSTGALWLWGKRGFGRQIGVQGQTGV